MRKLAIIIASIILIISSCTTTKYIDREVPIETVRTEYINQIYKDSVYVHDSIDRYIHGDTVYQYKYKYIYKYLTKNDTIVKTDSIEVPVKVTEFKEVNRLKFYQEFLIGLGIATLLFGLFKLIKLIKKIKLKI